jgi:uncharacterized protein (DUF362 family)
MPVVSIAREENRYKTVHKALELISEDIKKSIKGKKKILIKPNFVSDHIQLAATHVDCVRAIIDFILPFTSRKIIIAEDSAHDTFTGYRNFGYLKLKDDYGVELVDLNEDDYEEVEIFSRKILGGFGTTKVEVAKTVLESDYRISPAMLKTHDIVIATLSMKNMVMGSVIDKTDMHQGYQAINLNIYKVAKLIPIRLAVIDGWEGMEGIGPVLGTPVNTRIAIASTDYVAADTIGASVMGIDPREIGYLSYAAGKYGFEKLGEGELKKIETVGLKLEETKKIFKLHYGYEEQKKWKIPEEKIKEVLSKV